MMNVLKYVLKRRQLGNVWYVQIIQNLNEKQLPYTIFSDTITYIGIKVNMGIYFMLWESSTLYDPFPFA